MFLTFNLKHDAFPNCQIPKMYQHEIPREYFNLPSYEPKKSYITWDCTLVYRQAIISNQQTTVVKITKAFQRKFPLTTECFILDLLLSHQQPIIVLG